MATPLICPVRSSQEWKELVEAAGSESRAYSLYIANNFQIPTSETIPKLQEEEKPRFSVIIESRVKDIQTAQRKLADLKSKLSSTKNKNEVRKSIQALESKIESITDEIRDLKKLDALESVADYAERDLANIEATLDRFYTSGVTLDELNNVLKDIRIWEQAGDFSNDDHLFFTEEEMEGLDDPNNEILQDIRSMFSDWKTRADRLHRKYLKVGEQLMDQEIKNMFGDDAKLDLKKRMKDVTFFFKNTIDISEVDNELFELMSQWVRKANWQAKEDVEEDWAEIEKIMGNLRSKGKMDRFINLIQQTQSNEDARHTGDLTFRFTQKWFDDENNIRYKLHKSLELADQQEDPNKRKELYTQAYSDYWKAKKEISHVIDMRKLFFDHDAYAEYRDTANENFGNQYSYTEKDRQEYIQELKSILGEEGYQYYIDSVKEKLEEYIKDEQAQEEYLQDVYGEDAAAIMSLLEEWKYRFNPFWNSHYFHEGHPNKKIGGTTIGSSTQYVKSVARRNNSEGANMGYYDTNFELIMEDSDMKEAYNYILTTINEYVNYLPSTEVEFFQINSLPIMRKEIMETFLRDGVGKGLSTTWNKVIESTRSDLNESLISEDINERYVQTGFISSNDSEINDYIHRKTIAYKLENPEASNEDLRNNKIEWKKEIQDKLASQRSWDLEKLIKAFTLNVSEYKHKTKIEDSVKVLRNMVDELQEQKEGTYTKTSDRLGKQGEDLVNAKEMLDYAINHFFGYNVKKVEGKTGKQVLTKDEKKDREEIKNTLDKVIERYAKDIKSAESEEEKSRLTAEFEKEYETLQKQLENLGGRRTWSNIGNSLLKFFQIKGIGWNLFSAFNNRGFGIVANWIEAADGRKFGMKELKRARALMYHSVLKNLTFDKYSTESAQKIRAAMERFDILKESKNEIFEQKLNTWSKRFKFASPYNMQSRGEYINQGEIMIATLLKNKVKLGGEEVSMWDAMDNTGKLKDNVELPDGSKFKSLEDYVFDVKSKADKAIRRLHGNYDYENSPLLAKKTFLGRALSQFRTWAYMGFYERFGGTRPSRISGITEKGRYRSYGTLFKSLSTKDATVVLIKNLLRKLMFQNTQFDELIGNGGFTEADAANLRKNLQELVILNIITGLGILLRAAVLDDDDKESNFKSATYFWLNIMNRINTDLLFYANPAEFEKLQRQAIPIFSLVTDSSRLLNHGFKLATGQTGDQYETGVYAGQSKSWRYTKNIVPFLNQINKLESLGSQIW